MRQSFRFPENTLWALRKNGVKKTDAHTPSLHEALLGYEPIRIAEQDNYTPMVSAENPQLNIITSQTNFLVMELASEDAPKA
jgi:hypothetical protein